MNYQEVIIYLKILGRQSGSSIPQIAINAIETLLEERDELMKELHGHCDVCANKRLCYVDKNQARECALSDRGLWKWRGPRKEVIHQIELAGFNTPEY